jgi:hypothetical protein
MKASITQAGVRTVVWYANKVMRHSLQGLFVDDKSLQRVKDLIQDKKNKVVLLPIYKSFADFFIQTYIFHHFGVGIPFTFGNLNDVPEITGFKEWF